MPETFHNMAVPAGTGAKHTKQGLTSTQQGEIVGCQLSTVSLVCAAHHSCKEQSRRGLTRYAMQTRALKISGLDSGDTLERTSCIIKALVPRKELVNCMQDLVIIAEALTHLPDLDAKQVPKKVSGL